MNLAGRMDEPASAAFAWLIGSMIILMFAMLAWFLYEMFKPYPGNDENPARPE